MDLFMVVYQQGTWFDVTRLPTNLTHVDVANAFRKQWPHLKKAYMTLAVTDPMIVAAKKQKGRRYKRRVQVHAIVYQYKKNIN